MQIAADANVEALEGGAHGEHQDLRFFGLVIFLLSEGMIFVGLFAAYIIYRLLSPAWPPEGTEELEVLLPGINTVILVSSSFVIHQADLAIKRDDIKGVRLWFGLTALMGAIFLAGQVYEYMNLEFGLTTNRFASSFFLMTGFHGLHVTVGVLLILGVLFVARKPESFSSDRHFGIEAASIYWHFVDVIWIVLFLLLYIW
ncbi:MAG: heme-copper oxidase subunit III [Cyanobacteria bacterium J06642_2]